MVLRQTITRAALSVAHGTSRGIAPSTRTRITAISSSRGLSTATTRSQPLSTKSITSRVTRDTRAGTKGLGARGFATGKSEADAVMEDIQEQYATAKDEFEIAVEETEKKTVYAADDRAAAAEEFKKLKELFEKAMAEAATPAVAAEIKTRAGQRVRELDEAIKGLEQSAMQD